MPTERAGARSKGQAMALLAVYPTVENLPYLRHRRTKVPGITTGPPGRPGYNGCPARLLVCDTP